MHVAHIDITENELNEIIQLFITVLDAEVPNMDDKQRGEWTNIRTVLKMAEYYAFGKGV